MTAVCINRNQGIEPDYHLIKLEERTFWCDAVKARTTKVWGVYAFDRNSATHLCEATPSYCLVWIATDYEEIDGLDEDARNELNELVLGADSNPVDYMHCNTVDRLITADPEILRRVEVDAEDFPNDRDERFNAAIDQIAEGWGTGALMY